MKTVCEILADADGLYRVLEETYNWTNKAFSSEKTILNSNFPIDWFGYTKLQRFPKIYNAWSSILEIADDSMDKFTKMNDFTKLFISIDFDNFDKFKSIPESLFLKTYKKFGLRSKQFDALIKLYKD